MSSPANSRFDALRLAVKARRLAHEKASDVEHVDAEVEDHEVIHFREIGLLAVDVVAGAERDARPGRLPMAPESMISRAFRTGVRNRVFSCTMKGIRAASRQVSTIATQSFQVGASGFCTIDRKLARRRHVRRAWHAIPSWWRCRRNRASHGRAFRRRPSKLRPRRNGSRRSAPFRGRGRRRRRGRRPSMLDQAARWFSAKKPQPMTPTRSGAEATRPSCSAVSGFRRIAAARRALRGS